MSKFLINLKEIVSFLRIKRKNIPVKVLIELSKFSFKVLTVLSFANSVGLKLVLLTEALLLAEDVIRVSILTVHKVIDLLNVNRLHLIE